MQCIRPVGWSLHGVLIYLWLATYNKLNELSGIGVTACDNSFLCNFVGETKESDGGKFPALAPLATLLIRDPGAWVSCIGI